MNKIEELKRRFREDYDSLIQEALKEEKEEIVKSAYYLAHLNEIDAYIEEIDEEDPPFKNDTIDRMLDFVGNVLLRVWYDWLDYNHPENFNFFDWAQLGEIISYAFRKESC